MSQLAREHPEDYEAFEAFMIDMGPEAFRQAAVANAREAYMNRAIAYGDDALVTQKAREIYLRLKNGRD
jgi:hypothetical protein